MICGFGFWTAVTRDDVVRLPAYSRDWIRVLRARAILVAALLILLLALVPITGVSATMTTPAATPIKVTLTGAPVHGVDEAPRLRLAVYNPTGQECNIRATLTATEIPPTEIPPAEIPPAEVPAAESSTTPSAVVAAEGVDGTVGGRARAVMMPAWPDGAGMLNAGLASIGRFEVVVTVSTSGCAAAGAVAATTLRIDARRSLDVAAADPGAGGTELARTDADAAAQLAWM